MGVSVRVADSKGRVSLPGFANATVIVEAVGPNEYRVRKAEVIPADELTFPEENMPTVLSEESARAFLDALDNPPKPTPAARRAAKRFRKTRG